MDILGFLAFLWCVSIAACSCPPGSYKSSFNNVCCDYCPAGHYMKKECEGSTSTQCEPCPGNSFTSEPNKDLSCKSCRKECRSGKVRVTNCTNKADTVCQCPKGKFWDNSLLKCSHCTKCGPGQRMIVKCQEEKDGVCETCGERTYLAGNECVPCSYCHQGEMVAKECAPASDTVCQKADLLQPTKLCKCPSKKPKTTQTPPNKTKPMTDTKRDGPVDDLQVVVKEVDVLGPTMWILIGVIIVLIIVVVFLLVLLCKGKRKYVVCKNHGKKDVISTDTAESAVKENYIMFRTVRADIVERLGHMLNSKSGKNWKHLAGLMGYSSTDTQSWSVLPNEAAQNLLHDWSTHNGSTVYALYKMLKKLRRDDAASLLLPLLVDQVFEGETV